MTDLKTNIDKIESGKKRFLSIDFFKGISIILMVFVNTLKPFDNVPIWSKHAGDFGLTYVDLIAPFFIFMMALNFKISFQRKLEISGRKKAYSRFIFRYLVFIGLGLLLFLNIDDSGNLVIRWGTLQVLGASGLIALLVIELKPFIRIVLGFFLMLFHQLLLDTFFKQVIYDGVEGGIFGILSWGGMLIISTVIAEGFKFFKEKNNEKLIKYYLFSSFSLIFLGFICNSFYVYNFNWIISRQYMSFSYSVLTIGISSLVYGIMFIFFEIVGNNHPRIQKENYISVIGKNAFMLFILHIFSISIIIAGTPLNVPMVIVFIIGLSNVFIIWIIGFYMNKLEIFIVV